MRIILFCFLLLSNVMQSQEIDITDLAELQEIQEALSVESQLPADTDVIIEDNLQIEETIQASPVEGPFFGYNFFESTNDTSAPVLDIPLQADYILSFNDEVQITLIGNVQRSINTNIDLSGNVLLPEIGYIALVDLSLSEANKKLKAIIEETYIGTEIYLSVITPSLRKVSVIGAVKKPGTYLVNPFLSLIEIIKYANGLDDNSSIRAIKIISSDGSEKVIDLYDFLIYGDSSANINLKNGDTVIVGATNKFVRVMGGIQRSKIYEYTDNDSYADLINFAQGFVFSANKNLIAAQIIQDNVLKTSYVEMSDRVSNDGLLLELIIGKLNLKIDKDAVVQGDSVTSGLYQYSYGDDLSIFLSNLEFSDNLYPFFAILDQEISDYQRETKYFSLNDPQTVEGIKLLKNPELRFYSRDEILKVPDMTPDLLSFPSLLVKNVSVGGNEFAMPIVGFVTPKEIFQFINYPMSLNKQFVSTIKNNETILDSYDRKINSLDVRSFIFPDTRDQSISISISGQVNYPGVYEVSRNSSLADVYDIAGGLTNTAGQKAILLTRESIRKKESDALQLARKVLIEGILDTGSYSAVAGVQGANYAGINELITLAENIEVKGRLTGDFSYNSSELDNIILEDGDEIFVPNIPTTVTILGEVNNPLTVSFKDSKNSLVDYINLAGGFSKNANNSNIYIIRSNGESISANNGLFSSNVIIQPGDTIVVPSDFGDLKGLPLVSVATQIISQIAFAAASLNVLNNN